MNRRMLLGIVALAGLSGPAMGQTGQPVITVSYSEPKVVRTSVSGNAADSACEVLSMPISVSAKPAEVESLPATNGDDSRGKPVIANPVSRVEATPQAAGACTGSSCGSCGDGACGCLSCCGIDGICGPPGRCWVSAEYLGWWTNGFRLPPLLTTSPAWTPPAQAGVLGQPGTSVLFGDSTVGNGYRSGGRFTLGTWLNECQTCGIEAGFFFLANQTTEFAASSVCNPTLAIPFTDGNPARPWPNSFKTALMGFSTGSFEATTRSEIWGAEVNGRINLCCDCNYRVDALSGFRFIHLHENLVTRDQEVAVGLPFPVEFDVSDRFSTTNNFYGGQLGLAGEYRLGYWFVQATGKVALGETYRTVNIDGSTNSVVVTPQPPQQGGIFALPTNMGTHRNSGFSVVPEVDLNLGYQLTKHLRATVGYTFLYWSHVARPGGQIDTTINTTQAPLGLGLVGASRPVFSNSTTDFWAQGFNLGLEYRY